MRARIGVNQTWTGCRLGSREPDGTEPTHARTLSLFPISRVPGGMTRLTVEGLAAVVETGAADTVFAGFTDMHGRLVGRRIEAGYFQKSGHRELRAAPELLATDLAGKPIPGPAATGDHILKPDFATLRMAEWAPRTALVLCDLFDATGHATVPHSPRQVLKKQVVRAKELGFDVVAAAEFECQLFQEGSATPVSAPLTAVEAFLEDLRAALKASDLQVESTRAAEGRARLNLRPAAALDAADDRTILRYAAQTIGARLGLRLALLPKPLPDGPGAAGHIHLALWSGREPAFLDSSLPRGMSRLLRAFLGGLLRGLDDCAPFYAPSVNAYKRLGGAAPMLKAWSIANRNAAFRLCGEGTGAIRIECRAPGADANPYLAMAAFLAAGLDGIAQKLDCGDPAPGGTGQGPVLPGSLREAALALRGSSILRAALGDAVVDHYVRAADWEQRAFDRAVTDWEIARGLGAG